MDQDFRLEDWVVQPSLNTISLKGRTRRIEPKAMEVLVCLAQYGDHVVSKEQLIKTVWTDTFVTDDVLTRCISDLRRAFEDETKEPRFIQTIPKRGYRLLVPAVPVSPLPTESTPNPSRPWVKPLQVGLLLAFAVGISVYLRTPPQRPVVMRFVVQPPPGRVFDEVGPLRISPDGTKLVLFTSDARGKMLWLRRFDSATIEQLPGGEGADPYDGLAWSPDSRYVLFVTAGKLRRTDTAGGVPETLCEIQGMSVDSWGPNETVLLSRSYSSDNPRAPMKLLDLADCSTKPLLDADRSRYDWGEKWASFLPDGKHYLYAGLRIDRQHDVRLGSLSSESSELQIHDASDPRYVEPGYIFFERRGYLFAQPFSLSQLRFTGNPIQIVSHQLSYGGLGGIASYDVSRNALAYQEQQDLTHKLYLADSIGKELEVLDSSSVYTTPRMSPDGKKLLTGKINVREHSSDLWVYDIEHQVWEKTTFEASKGDHLGVWSRNGASIVYGAAVNAHNNLYRVPAHPPYKAETLLESNLDKYPTDFTPDGRFLLYIQATNEKGDLWLMPMEGGKSFPLAETPSDEQDGRFSPDGRWIVYTSDESGIRDIYVRSFSTPADQYRISWGGGRVPRWSLDGRKIYYLTPDEKLMEVTPQPGPSFKPGAPRLLFSIPGENSEYEVLPHGKFLVNEQLAPWHGPLTVVLNWASAVNLGK